MLPLGDGTELVPGAPDPLDPASDRLRRLDLDHQIDRAHVDSQLQRGGGDEARQLAGLEELLDDLSLLPGQRPVMSPGDLGVLVERHGWLGLRGPGRPGIPIHTGVPLLRALLRLEQLLGVHLVQPLGQALGAAPVVDEDDGRGVLADQLQQLGIDRRPDRVVRGRVAGHLNTARSGSGQGGVATVSARLTVRWPRMRCGGGDGVTQVLDRDDDLEVHLLADAGVDDRALPTRPDQELGDALERALGRRKPDPLQRLLATLAVVGLLPHMAVQALQGQCHVRAAFGRRDGVDLVDDQRLDVGEDLPRAGGHHQVQGLGRRDQDVGRLAQHRLAVLLRRVAGAQAD